MGIFENILHGFQVGLEPINLLFCFIGALIGTLVGVLPGIGPAAAIALLLPATFKLSPTPAIIMLAGIYYGAAYGGSTTSILINIPGEASSVVTCLDGHKMALKGKAGPALGISAIGSFIAGTLAVIGLMIASPTLAKVALKFGPPEYFSVMLVGLTILTYLARGSLIKALIMGLFGLFLSQIGIDSITGKFRFTFGVMRLSDGIDLVPMVMGLFGISEVLLNLEKEIKIEFIKTKIKDLFPNLDEWKRSLKAIIRGTILGFFLGVLPGGGAIIASFASYGLEKRVSRYPEKFGTGVIEGVAGPESANNAASVGAFVPLLTLGIPSNVVMALIFGALLIHGIQPGPFLISEHPKLFWGVISSMYIGNIMLLILNLPMIWIWVQVMRVPYKILFPLILLFCLIGSYSINNSIFDIILMLFFGILGYLFRKLEYEPAPLVLAFVLGKLMEKAFRQSLSMSGGSFSIFFDRPISAICIVAALILLITSFIFYYKKRKPSLLE
ncbi:MAG: tripartite tricarboxylate transporter permease [Nitrospirota bacterium]